MTTKLVTLQLGNDKELLVEVDETSTAGVKAVGLRMPGEIDFVAALETIKSAARELHSALMSVAVPPSNCEICFGIKLSASAGVILAKAGTEANFTIKMSWSGNL